MELARLASRSLRRREAGGGLSVFLIRITMKLMMNISQPFIRNVGVDLGGGDVGVA